MVATANVVKLEINKLNVPIVRNTRNIKIIYLNFTLPSLSKSLKWSPNFVWSNYTYNFQFET